MLLQLFSFEFKKYNVSRKEYTIMKKDHMILRDKPFGK